MNKMSVLITLLFENMSVIAKMMFDFMDSVQKSFATENENKKKLCCCFRMIEQATIKENVPVIASAAKAVMDVIQIKSQPETVVLATIAVFEESLSQLTSGDEINVQKITENLNNFASSEIPI